MLRDYLANNLRTSRKILESAGLQSFELWYLSFVMKGLTERKGKEGKKEKKGKKERKKASSASRVHAASHLTRLPNLPSISPAT